MKKYVLAFLLVVFALFFCCVVILLVPTENAPVLTPTPSSVPTQTHTPTPISYTELLPQELSTYPDNHAGENVKVYGVVFNINGDEELQMYLGDYEYPVYIVFSEPFSEIYEDDYITVYGTVHGENCGTNAFGGEVCQALIFAHSYTK